MKSTENWLLRETEQGNVAPTLNWKIKMQLNIKKPVSKCNVSEKGR